MHLLTKLASRRFLFFHCFPLCCAELASLQEGAYILNGYIGKLLLDLFVQQVPTTVTTADMKIIDLVEQVLTGQVLEVGVGGEQRRNQEFRFRFRQCRYRNFWQEKAREFVIL